MLPRKYRIVIRTMYSKLGDKISIRLTPSFFNCVNRAQCIVHIPSRPIRQNLVILHWSFVPFIPSEKPHYISKRVISTISV